MYHLLVVSTLTQFFHIFYFSYMEINIRDKLQLFYLPIPVSISLPAYLEVIIIINLLYDQHMVYSFIAHITIIIKA